MRGRGIPDQVRNEGHGWILAFIHWDRKEAISSSKYSSTDMVVAIMRSVVEAEFVDEIFDRKSRFSL